MKAAFSDQTKKVMQHAREEASRLGHNYIGTEHLLLGILKEGTGEAVGPLSLSLSDYPGKNYTV